MSGDKPPTYLYFTLAIDKIFHRLFADIEGADIDFFRAFRHGAADSGENRFRLHAFGQFRHRAQRDQTGEDHPPHLLLGDFDKRDAADFVFGVIGFGHQIGIDEHGAAGFQVLGETVVGILRQRHKEVDGGGAGVDDFFGVDDDIDFGRAAAHLSGVSGALHGEFAFKISGGVS